MHFFAYNAKTLTASAVYLRIYAKVQTKTCFLNYFHKKIAFFIFI